MRHSKKVVALLLLIVILSGCVLRDTEIPSTIVSEIQTTTNIDASTTTTSESTQNTSESLTYSVNEKGYTVVNGTLANGILVSAEILCDRNISQPGEASSYAIQVVPYSEKDRTLFVSSDWTLTQEETEEMNYGEAYLDGTGFRDSYSDSLGQIWGLMTLPMNIYYYSARGTLLSSLITSTDELPDDGKDFSFATLKDGFSQASTFLTAAGFTVANTHDVYRISYSWFEQSEKMCEFYGDDTSAYKKLYPQGFTKEDNAYLFYLNQEIDGLPIQTVSGGTLLQNGQIPDKSVAERVVGWTGATILITNKGVENAYIGMRIQQGDVVRTDEICSFETALANIPTDVRTESAYDDVYSRIGIQTTGITTVVKAELGYLIVVSGDQYIGEARPCWIFELEWEDPNSTNPIYVKEHAWDIIDAYTGQHIPATTTSLEPI